MRRSTYETVPGPFGFSFPKPPAAIVALVARLPQFPPSAGIAVLLNLVLRDALVDDTLREARGKRLCVSMPDLGLKLTFELHAEGIAAVPAARPDVTVTANSDALWALARGHEDADTLFFSRRLVMSGDTELGLLIRNRLEAIDPQALRLTVPRPALMLQAIRAGLRPARGAGG